MLFASISDYHDLKSLSIDGIELRLDLFAHLDSIEQYLTESQLPIMFTLRRTSTRSEADRESLIQYLFTLRPAFFDLEYDMRPEFLQWAFSQGIAIVLSYHNSEETPLDLEPIFLTMSRYSAFSYKIATTTHSVNDALRLLLFAKRHPNVSAICMGERGAFGRVLGPIVGNKIDYGHVGVPTASGQFSIDELNAVYRYQNLNSKTALFGLIGNPVVQSPGHHYHNDEFEKHGLDAVYVKMIVEEKDLNEFFRLAKELGFRGLSVTMPLKEKVIPNLGSVNTILFEEPLFGTSFDGSAAMDAIGDISNKKIILLGSGGAAHAVELEAKKRGADVRVLKRTSLNEVPSDYDILINCTPASMPIDPQAILARATVMDMVYAPRETPFLKAAAARGCRIVYGDEMFKNQAEAQSELWRANI